MSNSMCSLPLARSPAFIPALPSTPVDGALPATQMSVSAATGRGGKQETEEEVREKALVRTLIQAVMILWYSKNRGKKNGIECDNKKL